MGGGPRVTPLTRTLDADRRINRVKAGYVRAVVVPSAKSMQVRTDKVRAFPYQLYRVSLRRERLA